MAIVDNKKGRPSKSDESEVTENDGHRSSYQKVESGSNKETWSEAFIVLIHRDGRIAMDHDCCVFLFLSFKQGF